ncbi:MAG TPA: hypothetical protein G4O12_08195 [Dehalococcoidia bacterium]|jgi:hypothetical protein|nr:hypothetical protein [Dehalococcoidia bacterium]
MDRIEVKGESIECWDCGASFYLTAEEAEWFDRRGLHKPRRCPGCRKARHKRNPPTNYDEIIAQAKALFPNDYRQGVRQ